MTMTLKDYAHEGAGLLALHAQGFDPVRFVTAWWFAENGPNWPTSNNPGNVSYHPGDGAPSVPTGGVFEGVTSVLDNAVCVYETPELGIKAWYEELLLKTRSHGGTKYLTFDLTDMQTAAQAGLHSLCLLIGESNWAGSHYHECDAAGNPLPDSWAGKLIFDAYYNTTLDEWFETAATKASEAGSVLPAPSSATVTHAAASIHYVQPGETLSAIGLRYQIPWQVLQRYNLIENADHIEVSQKLAIPHPVRVAPGETLAEIAHRAGELESFLAEVNRVNPDRLMTGEILFV